jgi:transmembrane sensor
MTTSLPSSNDAVSHEALRKQAREWLRLFALGDVKPWEAEEFKRWLHTSSAHRAAFSEVKQRWDVLKPGVARMLDTNQEAAAFHARTQRRPQLGRRVFLGAAVSAAAAVVGVVVVDPQAGLLYSPANWRADLRTGTGEQRALLLDDSIKLTLNTQTGIRRQSVDGRINGIDLLMGEAAIDLPDLPSGGRSFQVVAGSGRSLAESGRFEVRYLEDRVCVTCIEGTVRVQHPAGTRMLQASQQIVYDAHSVSGVAGINPADVSAWRKGELVFNETRLIDVLEEINRYRPGRIVLLKEAVRSDPVSGRFVIRELDSALAQLQRNFDLNARRLPGGWLILS